MCWSWLVAGSGVIFTGYVFLGCSLTKPQDVFGCFFWDFWRPKELPSLKLTAILPLKIGWAPKGNVIGTNHPFEKGRTVSFREGTSFPNKNQQWAYHWNVTVAKGYWVTRSGFLLGGYSILGEKWNERLLNLNPWKGGNFEADKNHISFESWKFVESFRKILRHFFGEGPVQWLSVSVMSWFLFKVTHAWSWAQAILEMPHRRNCRRSWTTRCCGGWIVHSRQLVWLKQPMNCWVLATQIFFIFPLIFGELLIFRMG